MSDRGRGRAGHWKRFAERSTLHGFRYIYIGEKCTIRRIIWGFLVVISVGLFAAVVYLRTKDYLTKRENVYEEHVIVEELDFPIVTICNNNAYRATTAIKYGLYDTLHHIYNQRSKSALNPDRKLDKLNMTEFIIRAGHQKHDLIKRCYWKGLFCDVNMTFQIKIIDDRICHQFNSVANREKTSEPGVRKGLSLLLNLEQYEYIPGVHNDAGIKLYLTDSEYRSADRSVIPLTPGHHVMAAITHLKIEKPNALGIWCGAEAKENYYSCLSKCREKYVQQKCGCATPSMNNIEKEYFAESNDPCLCSEPCSKVDYRSLVSYSDISNKNIQKMLLDHETGDDTSAELQRSFVQAREASQRAIPSIALRDRQAALSVIAEFKDYLSGINVTLVKLSNSNVLLDEDGVLHLDEVKKAVSDDIRRLLAAYSDQEKMAFSVVLNYKKILEVHMSNMVDFFGADKSTSELLHKLTFCFNKSENDHSACHSRNLFWTEKITQASRLSTSNYLYDAVIVKTLKSYLSVMDKLFVNATSFLNEIPQHKQCIASIASLNLTFWKSVHLANEYLNRRSFSEKLKVIQKTFNTTNIIRDFESSLENAKVCKWYIEGWGDFKMNLDKQIKVLSEYQSTAMSSLEQLKMKYKKMLAEYEKYAKTVLDSIKQFIEYFKTKTKIAELFDALTTRKLVSDIEKYLFELSFLFGRFQNDMVMYTNHINAIFTLVFKFDVPIIRSNVLWTMELINLARKSMQTDFSEFKSLHGHNTTKFIELLLDTFKENFVKFLQQSVTKQTGLCYNVLAAISRVQKLMKEYATDTKINPKFFKDNFVKVDVFYSDLSYIQKTQQPVFGLLSLLSEIGGFSAFMIGASILTVLEFIDAFVVFLIRLCKDPDYKEAESDGHTTRGTTLPKPSEKQHVYHMPDTDVIYTSLPSNNPPYNRGAEGGGPAHASPFKHKPQMSFQAQRPQPHHNIGVPPPEVPSLYPHTPQQHQQPFHPQHVIPPHGIIRNRLQ